MSKALVAWFSAEYGSTAKVAEKLAAATGADKFEIVPVKPYTKADMNYSNPVARCNREKIGRRDVPIAGTVNNMADYDTVYIGFPIWYYGAPNIIQTFVKQYDLAG
ncbi:MAG: flavodoxin, partial [Clostridia bacterium]|nr:flavodoxin [Clostridia bacterium]